MPPLLEMRGISKWFPGVRALDDVSLDVQAGEVHVLVGQNGAGKSTLIKVLCGAHLPDGGELAIDGRPARMLSPSDARRAGVAVIFQEFSLVPCLDIAQNIFLGREFAGRVPGTIDHRRTHAEARRLLGALGSGLDTRTLACRLGVAQQQLVEIAKALSQNARILVMDEPTAALSDREIERLFDRIRTLKKTGVAIIYISHRLQEIAAIGDRVTVLRDGRNVASLTPREATIDALVRLMIGRPIATAARERASQPGDVVLEVRDLLAGSGVRAASVDVRAGEVVGLAGLVGAGRTELARAIFGADRIVRGSVRVDGRPLAGGPAGAVQAGVGLVPENRKTEGLALLRSVEDNVLAAGLRKLFPRGWYAPAKGARAAAGVIARLRIAAASPKRAVRFLSGGNQQKIVVGKWLTSPSRFFIFDEPTRGIDVGAKAEMYRVIDRLAAGGAGVLMISSELSEIAALCDRAYVMRDKAVVGELDRQELTEANILRLAMHHG